SARVRYRDGGCVLEEEGDLHAAVLAKGDPSDVNLLRDRDEWSAIEQCVEDAEPGALVLIDGDMQPDWRVPSTFLAGLLARAADAEPGLGALSALCDDAAFPGYPYPLAVVDRLAACSGWLRADLRSQLDDLFDRAGVPFEVRERAFADRHNLMERA